MANDRIYLRCVCGESVLLFKYFPSVSYMNPHTEEMQAFMIQHVFQCGIVGEKIEALPFHLRTEHLEVRTIRIPPGYPADQDTLTDEEITGWIQKGEESGIEIAPRHNSDCPTVNSPLSGEEDCTCGTETEIAPRNSELVEILAERSHIGWMEEKQRQGFAPHALARCSNSFWPGQCGYPDEKHHDDMLPYADLPELTKEYDRVTVRGVLDGIEAVGYRVVKADTYEEAPS